MRTVEIHRSAFRVEELPPRTARFARGLLYVAETSNNQMNITLNQRFDGRAPIFVEIANHTERQFAFAV